MKKHGFAILTILLSLMFFTLSNVMAQEIKKVVGEVTKIELASDEKSALVSIKDNNTQNIVEVYVYDEETLNKFKSYKIREGDEVRCRYEVKDGKNISKTLLRTAGC